MSLLNEVIPESPTGGTRFGASFLGTWWDCPKKWFNQYVRPHPTLGGKGVVRIKTDSPLLVGGAIHKGLEAWYRSGWRDGNYEVEAALAAGQADFIERREEFESEEILEKDWNTVQKVLVGYHSWFGPGGRQSEFSHLKVLADPDGEPLIEREFEIKVAGGFIFTTKPDLIVDYDGYLCVVEHKSTSASGLWRLYPRMSSAAQTLGETIAIRRCPYFKDRTFNGVLINAMVKDRSPKSSLPPFDRSHIVLPDESALEKFEHDIYLTLTEMEACLQEYQTLLERGKGISEACNQAFLMNRNSCVQFKPCVYHVPCTVVNLEDSMFGSAFKARSYEKDEEGGDSLE